MAQDQYGDSAKANSSKSGSPQGPLQLAVNTGGTSTTGGDSMEDDEDAKSEGYSWKSHIHRSGKDVQSLSTMNFADKLYMIGLYNYRNNTRKIT